MAFDPLYKHVEYIFHKMLVASVTANKRRSKSKHIETFQKSRDSDSLFCAPVACHLASAQFRTRSKRNYSTSQASRSIRLFST